MPRISPAASDGRAFTTYVSSGLLNRQLAAKLGARDETEFRHMLQSNPRAVTDGWASRRTAPWLQPQRPQ